MYLLPSYHFKKNDYFVPYRIIVSILSHVWYYFSFYNRILFFFHIRISNMYLSRDSSVHLQLFKSAWFVRLQSIRESTIPAIIHQPVQQCVRSMVQYTTIQSTYHSFISIHGHNHAFHLLIARSQPSSSWRHWTFINHRSHHDGRLRDALHPHMPRGHLPGPSPPTTLPLLR